MKSIFLIVTVLTCLLFSVSSFAQCSKAKAIEEVKKVCSMAAVKAKDVKALKKQKKQLLFTNCGKNYVWVQAPMSGKNLPMILHPIKRKLNGKNIYDIHDENNVYLFQEFDRQVNASAKGEAWVDYSWTKPKAEKATPKTSFVKKCEGGWIAGSGIWKADVK